MRDREKLIALIRECNKFHEEAKEKWILGGKQGERPSLIASLADHLIANGVVVREKGEWVGEGDGYADGEIVYDVWYCPECDHCIDDGTDDPALLPNFCPNCGADMRKGENG